MFTTENSQKVFEEIASKPNTFFSLRELARICGLSPAGTLKILKQLVSEKLAVREKDAYQANVDNKGFISIKRALNLHAVLASGLVEFMREKIDFEALVLFGSYARGEDNENSDIDLLVVSKHKKELDLSKFSKPLKKPITLHILDLTTAKKEFKNNIINGIVLDGYLRLFK